MLPDKRSLSVNILMTPRRRGPTDLVTMGHIRSHYCNSVWCNHSAKLNADWLPDDTALLALDERMVCTARGLIGADVRPDWTPLTGSVLRSPAKSVSQRQK